MPEPQQPDLMSTFVDLQALMVTTPHVDGFLQHITQLAARLTGGMSCSVTLAGTQPYTVSSSDDLAERVDQMQYSQDAGPCLDAVRTGSATLVQDLDSDCPWPLYRRRAREVGVRSSMSLPLTVSDTTIGGLNLYSTRPAAFHPDLRNTLAVFAAQAAAALAMIVRHDRQAQTSAQLEEALSSRSVIDQALGILMAQQRCTAEEALTLLRSHSQNTNRKVRDVAADLIQRVSGSPPAPGTPFVREDLT
jgi:GAF domain-containing protein